MPSPSAGNSICSLAPQSNQLLYQQTEGKRKLPPVIIENIATEYQKSNPANSRRFRISRRNRVQTHPPIANILHLSDFIWIPEGALLNIHNEVTIFVEFVE
jgi:hypothetical protein